VTLPPPQGHCLSIVVPHELLQVLAARTAELVVAQLPSITQVESPWLDFEGAMTYLGFSRGSTSRGR
jgi:hypothetical protein